MKKSELLVLGVERGWQKSRESALEAYRKGLAVDILIKGFVEKQVLDMITGYPGIKISAIERFWFRPALFFKVAGGSVCGKLKGVGIEGKRIEKWLYLLSRLMGFKVFLVDDESRRNI